LPTQKARSGGPARSPRAADRKANSRLNALRHGLAAKLAIAGPTEEHVALTEAIAGPDFGYDAYQAAQIIADSTITLRNIRQLKLEVLNDKSRGFFDLEPFESEAVSTLQKGLAEASRARGEVGADIVEIVDQVLREALIFSQNSYAYARRRRELQPISFSAVEDLRRLERYERAAIRRRRRALFSLAFYNSANP